MEECPKCQKTMNDAANSCNQFAQSNFAKQILEYALKAAALIK